MKPIVICGPTASGKTDLAIRLACKLNGIIISADSRQVYKHLAIGTTKPLGSWNHGVYYVQDIPHYLVDFLEVNDTFNVGNFCKQARQITDTHSNTPIIFVGGTGMYLHGYFVGIDDLPASTPQSRQKVQELLNQSGKQGLHDFLAQIDSISASQIPVNNVQRTMRAIELFYQTGKPASKLKSGNFFKLPSSNSSFWVYLNWDREILNRRIEKRTSIIFEGMLYETESLLRQGCSPTVPALKSLGYPQIIQLLNKEISTAEALTKITTLTKQYAKRQRTWFNRYTNALTCNLLNNTQDQLVDQIIDNWQTH